MTPRIRVSFIVGLFVLLAAVLAWLVPRLRPIWQALRIPAQDDRFTRDWYPEIQAAVACVALVLSAWISIDFAFDKKLRLFRRIIKIDLN